MQVQKAIVYCKTTNTNHGGIYREVLDYTQEALLVIQSLKVEYFVSKSYCIVSLKGDYLLPTGSEEHEVLLFVNI